MRMFDRFEHIEIRYDELNELLSDPEVITDTNRFLKLSKEESELRETVETYRKYKGILEELEETEELLKEPLEKEMEELAKEERQDLLDQKEALEEQLKVLLLPKDENDERNVIMEIRGAAGGD